MHQAREVLEHAVVHQSEGDLVLVGSGRAARVRFTVANAQRIELEFVGGSTGRRSSVASVTFVHRRWAAAFLSHVLSMDACGVILRPPASITYVDCRRSPRFRSRVPLEAVLVVAGVEIVAAVVDISEAGLGLEIDGEMPRMGMRAEVRLGSLDMLGVITRVRGQTCGFEFRSGAPPTGELRALIRRCAALTT